MPRTPTTPSQVSGHRFLVRRIEHALVRADSRMLHDPLRTRSRALFIGCTLVVLLAAGTAILSLVRPQGGSSRGEQLVVVAGTQSLHVRINDRLHPVANLASARLILGSPAEPKRVRASALDDEEISFAVGIEAAPPVPASAPTSAQPSSTRAAGAATGGLALEICEQTGQELSHPRVVTQTVVRMSEVDGDPQELVKSRDDSAIVTDGQSYWLVSRGYRSLLDPHHPEHAAVARALGVETAPVRPVSAAFLRAIPEVPTLVAPNIPGRGARTAFAAPFDTIGNVVQVGARRVVVLDDGAATLSPVLGELLAAQSPVMEASENELAAVPVAAAPVVPGLPETPLTFADNSGWLCAGRVAGQPQAMMQWSQNKPSGRHVDYPHADGSGQAVDGFVDARSADRSSVAVSVGGAVHVISPEGMRFAVHDRTTLAAMGFNAAASPEVGGTREVDWEVAAALRAGPELSKQAALGPLAGAPAKAQ
ncbi:MAG: type VII secretion protein EccB [Corynebacterium sp.]|uniref:type VII secretion protein EccB n=1 Tax=Corynebacterium sp. TaxID=1720 RepID=UPI0026DB857F|nr:type VII secretion protein EccB [Corynebacterium sp.]MDO5030070.1 type VII secretion protein EccB [Corynebacterium sp.]